jgi:hypothetical protein
MVEHGVAVNVWATTENKEVGEHEEYLFSVLVHFTVNRIIEYRAFKTLSCECKNTVDGSLCYVECRTTQVSFFRQLKRRVATAKTHHNFLSRRQPPTGKDDVEFC